MKVGVQRDFLSVDEEHTFRVVPESESRREKLVLLKAKQRYEGADLSESIQVHSLSSTNIGKGLGSNSEMPEDKAKFGTTGKRLGDLPRVEVFGESRRTRKDESDVFKMANLRKSSAFVATENQMPTNNGIFAFMPKNVVLANERKETEIIEMADQTENSTLGETSPTLNATKPMQKSSESARGTNRANLLTLIRRRQQRRFRPPNKSTTVVFIQYFLSFLYYVGMSPIKPASAKKLPNWICRLQKVLFWILTLTSVLQALDELKYGWIQFNVDESMLNFLTLGFYVANLLKKFYYVKLLTTSAESISSLLNSIEKVNTTGTTDDPGKAIKISVGIGVLSIVFAISSTLFGAVEINEWTWETATLERSRELSESIFIWSSSHYEEAIQKYHKIYGANMTAQVKTLAAAGNFLNYCGTLHACVLLDLWSIISIQIFILQFHFSNALREAKITTTPTTKCPLSIHWQYYKRLRTVCDQSHEVFGKLFKMVQMQNLLLFGYFLFELMKKDPISFSLLVDLLSVVKVSITYLLMQKSSDQNEKYEECVIACSRCGPTIEMNGQIMSVGVLLKDMKRHPIGIGPGDFYVNETFVLKFVCAVGSMFMLLSGESDEKCGCKKD